MALVSSVYGFGNQCTSGHDILGRYIQKKKDKSRGGKNAKRQPNSLEHGPSGSFRQAVLNKLKKHQRGAASNLSNKQLYQLYLQTSYWAGVRRRMLATAGEKCMRCPNRFGLQVHHLSYDRVGREKDVDLLVLCRNCHMNEHHLPVKGGDGCLDAPVQQARKPT